MGCMIKLTSVKRHRFTHRPWKAQWELLGVSMTAVVRWEILVNDEGERERRE